MVARLAAWPALAGALIFVSPLAAQAPATQAPAAPATPADCSPDPGISYICGQKRAEDLIQVPRTHWILASWLDGGLVAIDAKDRSTTLLYPSPSVREQFDAQTYAGCPGAPNAEQQARFSVAGIALQPRKDGTYTFYAVHYGWERGLDVFQLDARGKTPFVTWIGCVLVPEALGLDGVVPLPDGGVIGTNWTPRGAASREMGARMREGAINGELWEWHPGKPWSKLPGSESSGPNGIEISRDGKWLYVCAWGNQTFFRLSRTGYPVERLTTAHLGFRPDNVRWAPDGMLIVAGQMETTPAAGHAVNGTRVVKIHPRTLAVTELVNVADTPKFFRGTGAYQVGNEIWVGSSRADRIAIYPVPK